MNTQERLLKHSIPVTESGCWLWTASTGTAGYGQLSVETEKGRRPLLAHRLSYEVFNGPVGDHHVLHRCDVRLCINPDHLFLGTHQENMDDKVRKSRQRKGERKGERVPTAVLSAADVAAIRLAKGVVPQRELAQRFGVTQSNISHIQSGKSWKHVLDHTFSSC